jgi:uncharacterized protein (TIGR01777 family)
MHVFITGGTGLIGTHLIRRLGERQDTVVLLTRRPQAARGRFGSDCTVVEGDPMQAGSWMEAVKDCDAVVNLAGEGIFNRRWNTAFKTMLRDSRVQSTENIVKVLERSGSPRVLVNASAIGYYGPLGDEEVVEEHPPGDDFLARICVDWERAAQGAQAFGVRIAIIRVGVVLAREGGALPPMMRPFKLFAGGPMGTGRQWISWIHLEDIVGLFLLALDQANAVGPLNGTAPNPVTNKEFTRTLGQVMHRPSFLPAPRLGLRLALGEVADLITTGQRVLPKKALALGYSFRFPSLETALTDLLG